MPITLGKCSNVLCCLSKQEVAVKIVLIVHNHPSIILESKANALWTRKLFSGLQSGYTFSQISLLISSFWSCLVIIDLWKTWICLSNHIMEWTSAMYSFQTLLYLVWTDNPFPAGKRGWEHSLLYGCCVEGYTRKKDQLQPDPWICERHKVMQHHFICQLCLQNDRQISLLFGFCC